MTTVTTDNLNTCNCRGYNKGVLQWKKGNDMGMTKTNTVVE